MFLCCLTPTFGSSNPGVIWKITYMRDETKSIYVQITQFLVHSLFHTWTLNSFAYHLNSKIEFFCISSVWCEHIISLSRNKLFQQMESCTNLDLNHSHKKGKDSLETQAIFSWILILTWNFVGGRSGSASTLESANWFWLY